jgi:hypothetical protein
VLGPVEVWRPGRPIPPRHVLTIARLVTPLIALDDPFEVQLRSPAGGPESATDPLGHFSGQRLAARLILALYGVGGPAVLPAPPVVEPAAGGLDGLDGPWIWSIPPRH